MIKAFQSDLANISAVHRVRGVFVQPRFDRFDERDVFGQVWAEAEVIHTPIISHVPPDVHLLEARLFSSINLTQTGAYVRNPRGQTASGVMRIGDSSAARSRAFSARIESRCPDPIITMF